jgi:hypothetical protein
MRYVSLFIFLCISNVLFSQANVLFSIPSDYTFTVSLGNFTSTKTQSWQARFDNIPAGEYDLSITVTSGNYRQSINKKFTVAAGYEATYFVIPYGDNLKVALAGYYTINQLYSGGGSSTGADGRLTVFNGKPVYTKDDIKDLKIAMEKKGHDAYKVDFIEASLKNGYLYVDDLAELLKSFGHDAYRVDAAKKAYKSIVDKQKSWKLAGVFSHPAYYDEFANYAAKQ